MKINLPHKLQRNAFMRLFPFFNKRVLGDLSNAKEFNIIQWGKEDSFHLVLCHYIWHKTRPAAFLDGLNQSLQQF